MIYATSFQDTIAEAYILVRCRAHYKLGDPVMVDQVEDAIVDLVVLRAKKRRLHLGPAAEGEV
jgi:hypothetical protein